LSSSLLIICIVDPVKLDGEACYNINGTLFFIFLMLSVELGLIFKDTLKACCQKKRQNWRLKQDITSLHGTGTFKLRHVSG